MDSSLKQARRDRWTGLVLGLLLCILAAWIYPTPFAGPLDAEIGHAPNEDWDWQLTTWEACRVQWAEGVLPTWAPWVGGGVPLLGNPEAPALFPGFLLALGLGTTAGLKLWLLLQWWLLILGGYLAGRSLGLSAVGAHLGALALLASSFLPEFVDWGHQMFLGICWLPLAWWAHRSERWSLTGVCLAMPLLQGAHYVFFFTGLLLVLDVLFRSLDPVRLRWLFPALALNALWLGPPRAWTSAGTLLVGGLLLLGVMQQRRRRGSEGAEDVVLPLLASFAVAALLIAPKVLASGELVGVSDRLTRRLAQTALNATYTFPEVWQVLVGAIERPSGHEGQNVFHHPFPVVAGFLGLLFAGWRRPEWGLVGLAFWCLGWADATPVNFLEAVNRLPGFDLLGKVERYSLVWSLFLGWGLGFGADAIARRSRPLGLAGLGLGVGLWLHAALPSSRHDVLSVDPAPTAPPGPFEQRRGGEMPGFETVRANRGRLDLSIAAPPDGRAEGLRGLGDEAYVGEAFMAPGRHPVEVDVDGSRWTVQTRNPGRVALNQNWYPGWRANGLPTEPWQGLVSAELPAGTHTFHYWPRGLGFALFLHLMGWGLAGVGFRRGR